MLSPLFFFVDVKGGEYIKLIGIHACRYDTCVHV